MLSAKQSPIKSMTLVMCSFFRRKANFENTPALTLCLQITAVPLTWQAWIDRLCEGPSPARMLVSSLQGCIHSAPFV